MKRTLEVEKMQAGHFLVRAPHEVRKENFVAVVFKEDVSLSEVMDAMEEAVTT